MENKTLVIMCQDISAGYAAAACDAVHNLGFTHIAERERTKLRAIRLQNEAAGYALRARRHMGIEY